MTRSDRRPDQSESPEGDSLGACLRRVYGLHLGPGESPREVLLTARDWPRTLPALRDALLQVGGRAWFPVSVPSGDDAPAILAIYDAAKRAVRLRPASEASDHARADDLGMDGRPLRDPARPPSLPEAVARPDGRLPA